MQRFSLDVAQSTFDDAGEWVRHAAAEAAVERARREAFKEAAKIAIESQDKWQCESRLLALGEGK